MESPAINEEFNEAIRVLIARRDTELQSAYALIRDQASNTGATGGSRYLLQLTERTIQEIFARLKDIVSESLNVLDAYDVNLTELEAMNWSHLVNLRLTGAVSWLDHILFQKPDFGQYAFAGTQDGYKQGLRQELHRKSGDAISEAEMIHKRGLFKLQKRVSGGGKNVSTNVQNGKRMEVVKGAIFIAMPMAAGVDSYADVHEAIKAACAEAGFEGTRVDEVLSNAPITVQILQQIERAEYVICDLTDSRPNVFYEAGYALGVGKVPIYVARTGTKLEFDLKDYPVIFFGPLKQLREGIVQRLNALKANADKVSSK